MTAYQLLINSSAVQRGDGAFIPADPGNGAWQEYQAWKSAGGIPTPVPLSAYQQDQTAKIQASCSSAIYAGFSSSALGAARTYPAKPQDQGNLVASVADALVATNNAAALPANGATVALGTTTIQAGQVYVCSLAGARGTVAPVWPTAKGVEVVDGAAKWKLWTTPFWCADAAGAWSYVDHLASEIQRAGQDGKAAILANLVKCQGYINQINAATTPAAVQAVVWA